MSKQPMPEPTSEKPILEKWAPQLSEGLVSLEPRKDFFDHWKHTIAFCDNLQKRFIHVSCGAFAIVTLGTLVWYFKPWNMFSVSQQHRKMARILCRLQNLNGVLLDRLMCQIDDPIVIKRDQDGKVAYQVQMTGGATLMDLISLGIKDQCAAVAVAARLRQELSRLESYEIIMSLESY